MLIDDRPTRIPQPQKTRDFVVGFTGCVIKRGAQLAHGFANGIHLKQLCVTTGDQQRDGVRQLALPFQVGHRHVAAQVVDAVERHAPGRGVRLRSRRTHQQCPGKTRANRGRHRIGFFNAGFCQRGIHHLRHRLQMCARGDLGYHPTENGVLLHRRGNLVRKDGHRAVCFQTHNAHTRLITRGLNTKHNHWESPFVAAGWVVAGRVMVNASAPEG